MDKVQRALTLLDRFETDAFPEPSEAARLLVEIFAACGHSVVQEGFIESDRHKVDCFVRINVEGRFQTIAVEVKDGIRPADASSVHQAFNLKASGPFDRAMVFSRSGFSYEALRLADTLGLGQIDLLGPAELRNWLLKQAPSEKERSEYDRIIRLAMRRLACIIAQRPEILADVEWRDLEKILREVFEGIGFQTKLTRPAKDGGFDLELTLAEGNQKRIYLVEVKHWTDKKPGPSQLKKFIAVTASKQAAGGLLLSTSGFSQTICKGIMECSPPIRLGEGDKVIALCKTYYRLRSAFWLEDVDLQETLMSGTKAVKQDQNVIR